MMGKTRKIAHRKTEKLPTQISCKEGWRFMIEELKSAQKIARPGGKPKEEMTM
jgi:hypothetical protein